MKHAGNMEPHYGLRKLSIGVASVLLGMSIYGVVGHADSKVGSLKSVDNSKNVNVDENAESVNVNGNDRVVLQSKNAEDAVPSAVNSEGGGIENAESDNNFSAVGSDQQFQQNSLVDASDNRNINLDISAGSVNQHFAGLQQSLVQQDSNSESDDIVQNVHVSLIDGYSELTHQPGYPWTAGSNTIFDLNLDKMSIN